MLINMYGQDVECPECKLMIDLVQSLAVAQIACLVMLQKQVKNWPHHRNVSSYCLYLGSDTIDANPVDFYHYEAADGSGYSTAIVTGNEPGDYLSGWAALAVTKPVYREHMCREFLCGLLTVDDLITVGKAALGVDSAYSHAIRTARPWFKFKAGDVD